VAWPRRPLQGPLFHPAPIFLLQSGTPISDACAHLIVFTTVTGAGWSQHCTPAGKTTRFARVSLWEYVLADSHSPEARAHRCGAGGREAAAPWRQPQTQIYQTKEGRHEQRHQHGQR
jgi:hypothetical protein